MFDNKRVLINYILFCFQYDASYRKWEIFCSKSDVRPLPADPAHVAACLSLHMYETESLSSVEMLRASIANKHHMFCLPNPTEHPRIVNLFKAFKREYGGPRTPAAPLDYLMVQKMMSHLYSFGYQGRNANLVTWRTVWHLVVNFFSLGRFSDLEKLTRSAITFKSEPSSHMVFTFIGIKNDWFSEGGEKVISADLTKPDFCPVLLTQRYLRFLGANYQGPMMPTCSPKNPNVPLLNSCVTYTACLHDTKSLLNHLGFSGTKIGEHSAKRGGASHAAEQGISKEDLQRLGGWKSSEIPSKYVDLSIRKRLELSRKLQQL